MGSVVVRGSGFVVRRAVTIAVEVSPRNARRPDTISYSTAPKANMSLRRSAGRPSICSGAMYWTVPSTVPAAVTGCSVVSVIVASVRRASGVFARPKSSSIAPLFVSMMLPGLMSR